MSKHYDNWERVVAAVLRREHDRQLALSHSRDNSSISSWSSFDLSSISSTSQSDHHHSLLRERGDPLHIEDDRWLREDESRWNAERQALLQEIHRLNLIIQDLERLNSLQAASETDENIAKFLQRISVQGTSGKACYVVSARKLVIAWGDAPDYWKWTSCAKSRFSEVAQLRAVCWLDIRGKIKTRLLSSNTTYGAFLVFKLADNFNGLESANGMIKLDDEGDGDAERRATLVQLQRADSARRGDGWMEVKLGSFYNVPRVDDGEVEARLLEIERGNWKSGLIVEGIEFRPLLQSPSPQTRSGRQRDAGTEVALQFLDRMDRGSRRFYPGGHNFLHGLNHVACKYSN